MGACLLAFELSDAHALTALEQLSPDECRFTAEVEVFWGRDPITLHPDYVPPDYVQADEGPSCA